MLAWSCEAEPKLGREPGALGDFKPGRLPVGFVPGPVPGPVPGFEPGPGREPAPGPEPVDREIDGRDGTLGKDEFFAAMLGEPVARARIFALSPGAPPPLPPSAFIETSATLR